MKKQKFLESFILPLTEKKTGAPHLKGVKVQEFNGQSITISVQPGDNNTRRIYYIQVPKGVQPKELFEKLQAATSLIEYKNKKEGEMAEKKHQGFLNEPEKTAIVLMEIKEKFGASEILERKNCVDSILKFMPANTPRTAVGPILGKMAREGFLKQIKDKYFPDRVTGYKFTQTALDHIKKYSAVKIEENTLSRKETARIVVELKEERKEEKEKAENEVEPTEIKVEEKTDAEPFFKKIMREFAEIKNKLARIEKENSELKMELGEFGSQIQFVLNNIEEINNHIKSFDGKLKSFSEIHCEFEKAFAPLRDFIENFNKYAEIQKQEEETRKSYGEQRRQIAAQKDELKKKLFNL